jgi:hypothetical protein
MYPIAIVALFFGFFATLNAVLPRVSIEDHAKQTLATNFCIYRTAVANYVQSERGINTVPENALALPPGYVSIRPWRSASQTAAATSSEKPPRMKLSTSARKWTIPS